MEWLNDVGPARAGDAAAQERLREYLAPFVHAVALASAPHHVANALVRRVLDQAMQTLPSVTDDAAAGAHALTVARKTAQQAALGGLEEQPSPSPAVQEARQTLSQLRGLPASMRERLMLRLVSGIPGPELAKVTRAQEGEVRGELERGTAEVARVLGQAGSFAGDAYLWELAGVPAPTLARIEVLLSALRYDPTAEPAEPARPDATYTELAPVTTSPRGEALDEESTTTDKDQRPRPDATVADLPPVGPKSHPRMAPLGPQNPFTPQPPTQAATDLPAAAQAKSSPRMAAVARPENPFGGAPPTEAASDLPAAAQGAIPRAQGPAGKSNARMAQVVPTPDNPFGGLPPTEAAADLPAAAQGTVPRPYGSKSGLRPAVAAEEPKPPVAPTREAPQGEDPDSTAPRAHPLPAPPVPVGAQEPRPTRLIERVAAAAPSPAELRGGRSVLRGGFPFAVAGLLVLIAVGATWFAVFATERSSRANWNLVNVVVASEDLSEGDFITQENIAFRLVPDHSFGKEVVLPENFNEVVNNRLAMPMQAGDPLLWSHFIDRRKAKPLSSRIQKRGRAISIGVNVTNSVGRMVKPGDWVDVIVSLDMPDGGSIVKDGVRYPVPTQSALTLLQDVPVVATGRIAELTPERALEESEQNYQNVSLMLLPEEVEMVTLGESVGRLTLTLRNEEDHEHEPRLQRDMLTDFSTLYTSNRVKALERKRFDTIQIIRQSKPAAVQRAP